MKTLLGLNEQKTQQTVDKLNNLLANYQVFYMNVRGFHWNIKGDNFFELHIKFEELYNDLALKIDEIAERILTLGHTPLHSFSDYLEQSNITEEKDVTDGKKGLSSVVDSLSTIIKLQREILVLSDENNDEGTNAMMSDYIREQEKLLWMYRAYLA